MTSPFDLTGQVALVTGSSRGIGRSIAETMASLGAKVVISSRKAEACEEVAAAITAKGGEAIVIPCNIGRKPEVEALIKGTLDKWGRIDSLVCNAAINPHFGPLAKISDDAFDKIMASNVKSNLWLANLAAPGMADRGGGTVIIVSSIGGIRGSAMLGAYGISKAADFSLARSLAVEWGPKNVRINCIAPGLVRTDFARALWEDKANLEKRLVTTPLRRIGEPEDIGGVAAFLASKAAAFITGQVIVADGGVTIA
ncbi:MAG: SDR family oxidoreductase [Hyphomicrobiaceae bacterium]|nr:SDR family oxidoreductase [Hyphomicrobiaceae bacterium]